jgi:HAD superfamily hydrolase (TIGR01509 family)
MNRRFSDEELQRFFDVVVISAEVGMVKPDPAIYHLTADKLGVSPAECIFIDDRQVYVQAAVNIGMPSIYNESFQQIKTELTRLLKANDEPHAAA